MIAFPLRHVYNSKSWDMLIACFCLMKQDKRFRPFCVQIVRCVSCCENRISHTAKQHLHQCSATRCFDIWTYVILLRRGLTHQAHVVSTPANVSAPNSYKLAKVSQEQGHHAITLHADMQLHQHKAEQGCPLIKSTCSIQLSLKHLVMTENG